MNNACGKFKRNLHMGRCQVVPDNTFTCLLEITALRAKIKELSDELSNQVKYD
jgi:hypothetical protein